MIAPMMCVQQTRKMINAADQQQNMAMMQQELYSIRNQLFNATLLTTEQQRRIAMMHQELCNTRRQLAIMTEKYERARDEADNAWATLRAAREGGASVAADINQAMIDMQNGCDLTDELDFSVLDDQLQEGDVAARGQTTIACSSRDGDVGVDDGDEGDDGDDHDDKMVLRLRNSGESFSLVVAKLMVNSSLPVDKAIASIVSSRFPDFFLVRIQTTACALMLLSDCVQCVYTDRTSN